MQASKGCWQLAGLRTEIKTVFDAYKLGKQSESLLSFLTRHDNRVSSHGTSPQHKSAPMRSRSYLACGQEPLFEPLTKVTICLDTL